MQEESQVWFIIHKDSIVRFGDKVCVPNDQELKKEIMEEAHLSNYTMHPSSTKTYKDLKCIFYWNNMKKRDCLVCSTMFDMSIDKRWNIRDQQDFSNLPILDGSRKI